MDLCVYIFSFSAELGNSQQNYNHRVMCVYSVMTKCLNRLKKAPIGRQATQQTLVFKTMVVNVCWLCFTSQIFSQLTYGWRELAFLFNCKYTLDRQYEHPKIVSKVVANALIFELQPKQQQINSHHQG